MLMVVVVVRQVVKLLQLLLQPVVAEVQVQQELEELVEELVGIQLGKCMFEGNMDIPIEGRHHKIRLVFRVVHRDISCNRHL